MLIFDESKMKKAKFNTSFLICGDKYGVVIDNSDGLIDDGDCDFVKTEIDQECWVINSALAEDYKASAMLFVYIPEIDYATTVISKFVTTEINKC